MNIAALFLIAAAKKKTEVAGTGGRPPPANFTPAEELEINKGRPVLEGIEGGTSSEIIPPSIRSDYIKGVCVCVFYYYHYSFLP